MECNSKYVDFLNKNFLGRDPYDILEKTINDIFKGKLVYVCSFGTESAVILHMISRIEKNLPILMLNTNFLFNETISYKDYILDKLNLKNFTELFPENSDLLSYDKKNILWKSNPDACCNIRKVLPLQKELKKYTTWISGKKGYQSDSRKKIMIFELINEKIVINPMANIKKEYISKYFKLHGLKKHPLYESGYHSVGCVHCTSKTIDPNEPRSGRWSGNIKTECGIHINFKN